MKKSKPEDSNNRYQIFNNSQLSDNNFLNNLNNNNTNKTKNYKRASMDNDDDLKNLKEPIIDKEKLEDLNKI